MNALRGLCRAAHLGKPLVEPSAELAVPAPSLPLDEAVAATATGDIWLFRGSSIADRGRKAP